MQVFTHTLSDGSTVAGLFSFPDQTAPVPTNIPLIVCLHGGSYDAGYFDVDPNHSIGTMAETLKLPVIAISRPSYGDSSQLSPIGNETTSGQAQGNYLNSIVLPELWAEFKNQTRATSIVLLTHSIGAMVGIIIAGLCTGKEGYPLAGLITSGIGSQRVEANEELMFELLNAKKEFIVFDPAMKDAVMLQTRHGGLADPALCKYTEEFNKPIPFDELYDINKVWLNYWRQYAETVTVPVMHGLGEFDDLWLPEKEAVEEYKAAFTASPRVEGSIIPLAPHCIELSYQNKGWLTRCLGFALECAVWYGREDRVMLARSHVYYG